MRGTSGWRPRETCVPIGHHRAEFVAQDQQALEARLKGVRSQKQSLSGELNASRAAHAADLQHFDSMENALGVACAEYSSLAARHARSISPPPTRAGASAEENERTFGSSPPEAMRTCTPRPAQTS